MASVPAEIDKPLKISCSKESFVNFTFGFLHFIKSCGKCEGAVGDGVRTLEFRVATVLKFVLFPRSLPSVTRFLYSIRCLQHEGVDFARFFINQL